MSLAEERGTTSEQGTRNQERHTERERERERERLEYIRRTERSSKSRTEHCEPMKAAEKCFIREVHSNEKVYTLFAGVARRKLLARCRCFDLAFTLAKNTRHAALLDALSAKQYRNEDGKACRHSEAVIV